NGGTRMAQRRLALELRALYEQGNVEPLEIVFGAKSIDEAMSSLDNLNRMTDQGEAVLHQLDTARVQLGSASRRLATRQAALASPVRHARQTASSLAATRAAPGSYIDPPAPSLAALPARGRLRRQRTGAVAAGPTAARAGPAQRPARVTASDTSAPTPAAPTTPPTAAAAAGVRTVTVSATGYSLTGQTATG